VISQREMPARAVVVVVAAALVGSACVTTRDEGEAMRADIATLKDQAAKTEVALNDDKAGVVQRLEALDKRLVDLEQTLATLRQADADSGVQMEKVIAEIQTIRGEVEAARHELGETKQTVTDILNRPLNAPTPGPAPKDTKDAKIDGQPVPADKQPHYDFAKKLYDDKKFAEAAEAFDLFLVRHGADKKLSDNAAYWKGEAYFAQAQTVADKKEKEKVLRQAMFAYQRVLESPTSEKSDGALSKVGQTFEQLGFKDEAKVFYEELIAKHPKSPLVDDAKKRLKALGGTKKKK
jgi:TolA-binding protein